MAHAKMLALSLIVAMPATLPPAAADAVDCEGAFLIMSGTNVGSGKVLHGNSCEGADTLLLPNTKEISVNWFKDSPHITGLAVHLVGEGHDAGGAILQFDDTLPLTERKYVRIAVGVSTRSAYWSEPYALPEGFRGDITATLLQGGSPYETPTETHALTLDACALEFCIPAPDLGGLPGLP